MSEYVSHGRGGQGNIAPDAQAYADGEIVREGPIHTRVEDGPVVTGRGGAGNIGSPRQQPVQRYDEEIIPETAMRENRPGYENFHVGRGGQGNVHRDETTHTEGFNDHHKSEGHHDHKDEGHKKSLGEKIKEAVTGPKH